MTKTYIVYFKDQPVAVCRLDFSEHTAYYKLLEKPGMKQPFSGGALTFERFYQFLKSRCYEDGRADLKEILVHFGMTSNNPYEWVEHTHGACYEDYFWIKEKNEAITYEEVKIHD